MSVVESSKMGQYIREYKHLIGCECDVFGRWIIISGVYHSGVILNCQWGLHAPHNFQSPLVKSLGYHLEDGTLVSYKDYMEIYYPEYKYVWEKQL